ncbi:MAG: rRNA pseudouridine synthase [Coriobacteriia bacterium]|nr:rRNA pseudouridine synthase [Coriobacteriia bacterium]
MRLNRFLARAGVASRRGSEDLMTAGRVSVNGVIVRELGTKVDGDVDEVAVDGRVVTLEHGAVYLALNKPAGYYSTMSDPHARHIVAELVPVDTYPGLFPVGRLDADTTGLLLFTTDGELAHRLLHPKWHVFKCYIAGVEGLPDDCDLQRLRDGVELEDGMTAPAHIERMAREDGSEDAGIHAGTTMLEIALREGRNRQVRRMCEAIGHPVRTLERGAFGPIELGDLAPGHWRMLNEDEVTALRTCVTMDVET